MKSRAITLGASVIALTFAAAGSAGAADLGNLNQDLKIQTQTKVGGPAGSVTAEGNVKVPVGVPSKGSVDRIARGNTKEITKGGDRANATVVAKRRSGDDRSETVLEWDGGTGVSAYADQRRKGVLEVEALVRTHGNRAHATVTGFARGAGKARGHSAAKAAKSKHAVLAERSIRKHWQAVAAQDRLRSAGRHEQRRTPLQAIGREVGNPIQLSLAGWLIVLAGAGFLGASRLVRRRQRVS
jgi:hypothetical protein